MLLSIQQRYIVEVLDKLGCLRREQIYILTRDRFQTEEFTISERRMDTMLHQLAVHYSNIYVDAECVRYQAVETKETFLEAVDVMLELSNGYPIDFAAVHDSTALLRFSLGSDPPKQYMVAIYKGLPNRLEGAKNVVWIAERRLPPEAVALEKHQYYAQRQEDGSHRFFGASI